MKYLIILSMFLMACGEVQTSVGDLRTPTSPMCQDLDAMVIVDVDIQMLYEKHCIKPYTHGLETHQDGL